MNLGKLKIDMTRGKKIVRWAVVGFLVLFIGGAFVTSYFKSKTVQPPSYQPSADIDEGFKKNYEELTKDRPKATQQKQALAEAASPKRETEPPNAESVDDWVARGGWKNTPQDCDSFRVKYAMLAFAFGKLVEENEALKQQIATPSVKTATVAKSASSAGTRRSGAASGSATSGSGSGFDFTQYFNRGGGSAELTSNSNVSGTTGFSDASFTWVSLSLPRKQQVYSETAVTFNVTEPFVIGGTTVPRDAKISGVAQVSQGIGRVYIYLHLIEMFSQNMAVEGEVYSLDNSRGINAVVHSESALAEGFKREGSELVSLFDPSRTKISRNFIQETDVGREYYVNLEAGLMVRAKIKLGR